jgi:hypothetical protein
MWNYYVPVLVLLMVERALPNGHDPELIASAI